MSRAFNEGYIVRDFMKYNIVETKMRLNELRQMSSEAINKLLADMFIERLTFVRDYFSRKTINFMEYIKDKNGRVVGVGHFTYNKDTKLLLMREYEFEKGYPRADLMEFLIYGARDSLREHGFRVNGLMFAQKPTYEDLSALKHIGIRVLGYKDNKDFHREFDNNKPDNIPQVIYYKRFRGHNITTEEFKNFLSELDDGNELKELLELFKKNPNLEIQVKGLSESEKLMGLLENMEE